MNPLIERYVYDTIQRLPETDREKVKTALISRIDSMLKENPTDDEVLKTLHSLGDPSEMAEQYRTNKRYLISPAVFDDYLRAWKLVGFILFTAVLIASLIADIITITEKPSITALLIAISLSCLKSICIAALISFTTVTIGFAVYEYVRRRKSRASWSATNLPEMPRQVRKILRRPVAVSLVLSIILNIIWVTVMIRFPQYLAWYDNGKPVVALFQSHILITLVPFVISLAISSWMVSIGKLVYGYWNIPLASLNAIYNIGNTAYIIYFFNYAGVFNEAFIAKMARLFSVTKTVAMNVFEKGAFILSAIILVVMIWDTVDCYYRAYRNRIARKQTIQ